MKKICILTTTRADFGILKNLIKKINSDKFFKVTTIVGGSHFVSKFGSTFNEIINNRIKINFSIKNQLIGDNPSSISKIFSTSLIHTSIILQKIKPDMIMVLGDRYEVLASVIAANLNKIPVVHIHGGEVTHGVLDDNFRHSITKLSHVHFTANKIYKKRIIQLGEDKKNIHVVGGLAADNIFNFKFLNKSDLEKKLKLKFKKINYVVNLHPETLNKNSTSKQLNILLNAIKFFNKTNFIFTAPGADLDNQIIYKKIKKLSKKKNIFFFKSLGQKKYFSLLKYSSGMIGNSSSGILEMPYFKKPTINIGNRQSGRLMTNSILNCSFDTKEIIKSIEKIEKRKLVFNNKTNLPYGKKGAIKKIIKILKQKNFKNIFYKKFIDIVK